MVFAERFGSFMSGVILSVLYITVILPYGLALRLFADPLAIKSTPQASNWKALPKKDEHQEQAGADADCSNGLCAVGKPADHHGVHYGHTDPSDFGKHQRYSQVKSRAKLGTQSGPGEHRE